MKMNNRFVLAVVLIGMPFFSCKGDGPWSGGTPPSEVVAKLSRLIEEAHYEKVYSEKVESYVDKKIFIELEPFKVFYQNKIKSDKLLKKHMQFVNNTLFLEAASSGSETDDIVEYLLDNDALEADLSSEDKKNKYMLNKKANVNFFEDKAERTALHLIMMVENAKSRREIIGRLLLTMISILLKKTRIKTLLFMRRLCLIN